MQWTPDRNAGFSTADPGKLYLPVVQSLDLPLRQRQRRGPAGDVVVAAALDPRHARHPPPAPGVRAGPVRAGRVRQPARAGVPAGAAPTARSAASQAETVLCVNNLSHVPQGVRLDLEDYVGCSLEDVFGGTGFPAVPGDGELEITMGSRDFFWLKVGAAPTASVKREVTGRRDGTRRGRPRVGPDRAGSVLELLADWLPRQRWYAGKGGGRPRARPARRAATQRRRRGPRPRRRRRLVRAGDDAGRRRRRLPGAADPPGRARP